MVPSFPPIFVGLNTCCDVIARKSEVGQGLSWRRLLEPAGTRNRISTKRQRPLVLKSEAWRSIILVNKHRTSNRYDEHLGCYDKMKVELLADFAVHSGVSARAVTDDGMSIVRATSSLVLARIAPTWVNV